MVTRQRIIFDLRDVADQIAGLEETERGLRAALEKPFLTLEGRIVMALGREIGDLDSDAARFYLWLRAHFKRMVTAARRTGVLTVIRTGTRERITDRRRVGRLVRRTVPDVTPPDADFVRRKLLTCDTFVDDVVAEHRSRLKQQQGTLRETLQSLGEYVEQGGIR